MTAPRHDCISKMHAPHGVHTLNSATLHCSRVHHSIPHCSPQLRNSTSLCRVAINGTISVHEESTVHDTTYKIRRNLRFCAGYKFGSKAQLLNATQAWCADPVEAEREYGHISGWEVSNVSDMSDLFQECDTFDEDVNSWDVQSVTNMWVRHA